MCGIGVVLVEGEGEGVAGSYEKLLRDRISADISKRGNSSKECTVTSSSGRCYHLLSSVLHIQGETSAEQPCVDTEGNVLLWNGEVFGGLPLERGQSDTLAISALLGQISRNYVGGSKDHYLEEIVRVMSRVHGPYAFVYYSSALKTICYGRDPFGRRSLLKLQSSRETFAISSLYSYPAEFPGEVWEELPIDGLFLISSDATEPRAPLLHRWPHDRITLSRKPKIERMPMRFGDPVQAAPMFLRVLKSAILRRVQRVGQLALIGGATDEKTCAVGVLFSGGIDSVLLAAVLHECVDASLAIDLMNVTFDEASSGLRRFPTPSPDRLAAVAAVRELQNLYPTRMWRLVHIDVGTAERDLCDERIRGLIKPLDTYMDLNIGTAFWFAARGEGYLRAYSEEEVDGFFSVKDNNVPLLRVNQSCVKDSGVGKLCSSRKEEGVVGKRCPTERCTLVVKMNCSFGLCSRCCRLVAKDGPQECPIHSNSRREKRHKKKMGLLEYSKNIGTTADDSGPTSDDCLPYRSPCKIVLVGIGADEQLAGYGRHRTTFRRETESVLALGVSKEATASVDPAVNNPSYLEMELDKDLTRLWKRNLGRDDRCVADNCRELWTPYLDEELVDLIQGLELQEIADLSLASGVGDKMILREAARLLGLSPRCCGLVKRAIQFGSRIAKHTNLKHHGSNRKGKGDMKIGENDEES